MIRRKTHSQRMRLAQKICEEIKGVLRDDLRAFVIWGSAGRGTDGPYSDLEVRAFTSERYAEHFTSFVRDGIKCDVSYMPVSAALRQVKEVDLVWPHTASVWNQFMPLYVKEGDDCLVEIKKAARDALSDEKAYAKARASAVLEMLEVVLMLKDARYFNKMSGIVRCLSAFAGRALLITGLVNRYFYTDERKQWEESKALEKLPRDYARLLEIVSGQTGASLDDRSDAAIKLWRNFRKWLTELGIDWEKECRMKLPKKIPKVKDEACG